MAVTKIHGIKTTVDKAIEYICNPDKTDQNLYISSFACSPETAVLDFKYTLDHTHDCRDPHNTNTVSYTHLDVYKRQGVGSVIPRSVPASFAVNPDRK